MAKEYQQGRRSRNLLRVLRSEQIVAFPNGRLPDCHYSFTSAAYSCHYLLTYMMNVAGLSAESPLAADEIELFTRQRMLTGCYG